MKCVKDASLTCRVYGKQEVGEAAEEEAAVSTRVAAAEAAAAPGVLREAVGPVPSCTAAIPVRCLCLQSSAP